MYSGSLKEFLKVKINNNFWKKKEKCMNSVGPKLANGLVALA
jgi:hypothetical protein